MQDDHFEWDDAKARANIARHDVSFETARKVFSDPLALDWLDDRKTTARRGMSRWASQATSY